MRKTCLYCFKKMIVKDVRIKYHPKCREELYKERRRLNSTRYYNRVKNDPIKKKERQKRDRLKWREEQRHIVKIPTVTGKPEIFKVKGDNKKIQEKIPIITKKIMLKLIHKPLTKKELKIIKEKKDRFILYRVILSL